MYKLFYFSGFMTGYEPVRGVWPSVESFLDFMRNRFGSLRVSLCGLERAHFIKIPFNGVHDCEATGYSLSAIKSRKALVSLAAKREGPGSRP